MIAASIESGTKTATSGMSSRRLGPGRMTKVTPRQIVVSTST
jgi:hypothetical protein